MLFRSSRTRRIDRALSATLDKIDSAHAERMGALPDGHTWTDVDALSLARDEAHIAAYDRADRLHAAWRKRVESAE